MFIIENGHMKFSSAFCLKLVICRLNAILNLKVCVKKYILLFIIKSKLRTNVKLTVTN